MAKLYSIIDDQGIVPVGPFTSFAKAQSFQFAHQVPGIIKGCDDPTIDDSLASNPEPQEMTASWARRMARSA